MVSLGDESNMLVPLVPDSVRSIGEGSLALFAVARITPYAE
jgi:hypothetical protein